MENCYTLNDGGEPEPGIEFVFRGGREIFIGDSSEGFSLPFRDHAGSGWPRCKDDRVLEATPYLRGIEKWVSGRGSWNGAVLRVRTAQLKFDPGLSSQFPVQHAWPGVETINPAFVQCGERPQRHQDQLVCLKHGARVFVADQFAHYIKVRWADGTFTSVAAEKDELVDFLILRAQIRLLDKFSGLMWTYRTLEHLGALGKWHGSEPARRLEAMRALNTKVRRA